LYSILDALFDEGLGQRNDGGVDGRDRGEARLRIECGASSDGARQPQRRGTADALAGSSDDRYRIISHVFVPCGRRG